MKITQRNIIKQENEHIFHKTSIHMNHNPETPVIRNMQIEFMFKYQQLELQKENSVIIEEKTQSTGKTIINLF